MDCAQQTLSVSMGRMQALQNYGVLQMSNQMDKDIKPVALKPCPFCGSTAEVYADGDFEGYAVLCSGENTTFNGDNACCPIKTFGYESQEAASAAWNRRPESALTQAREEGRREGMRERVKVNIPTDTMEQTFQEYYRRGYAAGREAVTRASEGK